MKTTIIETITPVGIINQLYAVINIQPNVVSPPTNGLKPDAIPAANPRAPHPTFLSLLETPPMINSIDSKLILFILQKFKVFLCSRKGYYYKERKRGTIAILYQVGLW